VVVITRWQSHAPKFEVSARPVALELDEGTIFNGGGDVVHFDGGYFPAQVELSVRLSTLEDVVTDLFPCC
jgi:hypothetical protein